MTYLKLMSDRAKRHLILPGQELDGVTTLCGSTITRAHNWSLITALTGDECDKCAALSFPVTRLRSWLDTSDQESRESLLKPVSPKSR
jgi:hypothetical protein